MPRLLSFETGPSYVLVKCVCGWREMVGGQSTATRVGASHLALAHADNRAASQFVSTRKRRGFA